MNPLIIVALVAICLAVYFALRAIVVWCERWDPPDDAQTVADDPRLTYDRRKVHLNRYRP